MILMCIFCFWIGIPTYAADEIQSSVAGVPVFEEGDVIGFIGDSITHAQYISVNYVDTLYQYYLTEDPERKIEFRNIGTSGYKASDVLHIYDKDPAFQGINKAVIMLGTNEAILRTPTESYIANLQMLIERLKADGLQGKDILILTPPICDEIYASNEAYAFEEEVLGYVEALTESTLEWGVKFLDIHTPMVELTQERRSQNSKSTLTVGDAIHPSAEGQKWIAYYILQAQGILEKNSAIFREEDKQLQQDMQPLKNLIKDWHQATESYRKMWIEVMMRRASFTETQIRERYDNWRVKEEAIREKIYQAARQLVESGPDNGE